MRRASRKTWLTNARRAAGRSRMTSHRRVRGLALCIVAVLVAAVPCSSLADDSDPAPRPLFESNDVLRVQIEAPFTTIMRDRESDENHEGLFHITDDSGARQTFDLKLRTRGNYRRDPSHCRFAPLRLNFRKKQLDGTLLEGQDRLKLVTHCENLGKDYEQSVVLEYLAYRILNELTDLSFRVRLLHIDYIDTEGDNKTRSKYAFVIEEDGDLSGRIGLQIAEVSSIGVERLDPRQAALVSVFQYFLGNTDFSPVRGAASEFCCHNILLLIGTDGMFVPVAYDFDLSGFVDSPYASPNPALKITAVTQRLYRGFCSYNDRVGESIGLISGERDAIAQLVQNQQGLIKASSRKALRFLDKFYERTASDSDVQNNFIKQCLQAPAPAAG